MLAIVHVSSRYNVSAVLSEARDGLPEHRRPARLRPGRDPLPGAGRSRADPGGREAAPRAPGRARRRPATRRSRQLGDRVGDRRRLVLLQEVLGRDDLRLGGEHLFEDTSTVLAQRRIPIGPEDRRRPAHIAQSLGVEPLLLLGQLEAANDLPERSPTADRDGAGRSGHRPRAPVSPSDRRFLACRRASARPAAARSRPRADRSPAVRPDPWSRPAGSARRRSECRAPSGRRPDPGCGGPTRARSDRRCRAGPDGRRRFPARRSPRPSSVRALTRCSRRRRASRRGPGQAGRRPPRAARARRAAAAPCGRGTS